MRIKYIKRDLFTTDCDIIAHGCNAKGRMGSGIAVAIKNNFPEAYQGYREEYETEGLTLGKVIWAISNGKLIANCITQETYGRDPNMCYISYDAIRTCMKALHREAVFQDKFTEQKSVAMPKIGAGLGGGNWDEIVNIIEEEFTEIQPVVYFL